MLSARVTSFFSLVGDAMPIKVIDQLPAVEALSAENVFVMTEAGLYRRISGR